jgi:organic radical activating enzyme
LPKSGPLFINLDLTTDCSYSCPFCVDTHIIDSGKKFTYKQVVNIIDTLSKRGLKSVLLIGGGEPTLHPNFEEIIKYLKKKNLQVGIVTNGSFMGKIIEVADYLGKGDWVRLSLDAGTDKTFQFLHRPKLKIELKEICDHVNKLKNLNKNLMVGFSYVIIWNGINMNGVKLTPNVNEIPLAAKLAKTSRFDYISFKPCLFKVSNVESLLYCETDKFRKTVLPKIKDKVKEAEKVADNKFKVVTTQNLKAVFGDKFSESKMQSQHCHTQVFRQILTPTGVYHCPAYRGFDRAKIGEAKAFTTEKKFNETILANYKNLIRFNPCQQCRDIACFYNQTNRWVEEFIQSGKSVDEIESCEDDNFFI